MSDLLLNYELPAGPLSCSQMSTWEQDPEKYISRYIHGEPFYETPGLLFGRRFSEALENPEECNDPVLLVGLELVDILDEQEMKHKAKLPGGLPVVAKYDSISMHNVKYLEYKTGKWEWTQERVDQHSQMWFYSALMYVETGCVFDSELQWVETTNCPITEATPEGICFTGEVGKFSFRPSMAELEEFIGRMYRVANEIGLTCHLYKTGEAPSWMDLQVIFEYLEALRVEEKAKAIRKGLESQVKSEMELEGINYFEVYGGRVKITAKGNVTGKIFE